MSWNTATVANGSHTVAARARDAAGNITTSSAVSVTVDNAAPSVSVTGPAAGATVSGSVNLTATAADNAGVAGVQFLVDGTVLVGAEDTGSPYSVSWDTTTAGNGTHTLTARARDTAGNTTTSAAVNVTVDNAAPSPVPLGTNTSINVGSAPNAVAVVGNRRMSPTGHRTRCR